MKRWLPIGVMVAPLVGVWLLLNDSVALGAVIVGAALSLAVLRTTRKLDLPRPGFRRPRAALGLLFLVAGDIVRSNIAVARLIFGGGGRTRTSGFLRIPLEMRAPYGLAALACIITATPGTIWVAYDSATNSILLHILDLVDEQQWHDTIKGRYEKRLMEVFE
jgi:multicomponent K+:H+ antiporter subunit E